MHIQINELQDEMNDMLCLFCLVLIHIVCQCSFFSQKDFLDKNLRCIRTSILYIFVILKGDTSSLNVNCSEMLPKNS